MSVIPSLCISYGIFGAHKTEVRIRKSFFLSVQLKRGECAEQSWILGCSDTFHSSGFYFKIDLRTAAVVAKESVTIKFPEEILLVWCARSKDCIFHIPCFKCLGRLWSLNFNVSFWVKHLFSCVKVSGFPVGILPIWYCWSWWLEIQLLAEVKLSHAVVN